MNLEKRIKRHVIGARLDLFAVTLPDYEPICRREIAGLAGSVAIGDVTRGGVAFGGRLIDVYRANLHLHTAGRILIRLARFRATNFRQLEKKAAEVDWSLWLPAGTVPRCQVTTRRSRLYHSEAIAQHIRGQIARHWSEMTIDPTVSEDQALNVRLKDDGVTLSLDSSGDNLYLRGWKHHDARAPLRETTAAIILKAAGYRPDRPLVDPMCGAGTFSMEAALMAKGIAPGLRRNFAFMRWPAFRSRQWDHLVRTASTEVRQMDYPLIWASDIDGTACSRLAAAVERLGLQDAVRVGSGDFFALDPRTFGDQAGLIVLNPPYGLRLTPDTPPPRFYARILTKLQRDFKGWRLALVAPPAARIHCKALPLQSRPLNHGGLQLTLFTGRI